MLYTVVIDNIKNNKLFQRYIGVSGRHNVKILGFSYHQTGGSGSIINVYCPQLGPTTTIDTGAGRTFLSFIYDSGSFSQHYGSMDLGVRELNNFLDFTFTDTTATDVIVNTRFILYLDINDARTEYPLLN
jgi:hypothetical protein